MTGKTHMAIGIAAGLVLSKGEPEKNQMILVLASAIGSLVPDLDHPKAKLNQKLLLFKNKFYRILFYLSLTIGFSYLYLTRDNIVYGLLGIMALLISISTHRGFTHSISGYFIATSIVKIISSEYNLPSMYLGFSLGYISHLIGDFFTVKGIKLFFPSDKSISSPISIKTSKTMEDTILMIIGLLLIYFISTSMDSLLEFYK